MKHKLSYAASILRMKVPYYWDQRRALHQKLNTKDEDKKRFYALRLFWKNEQIRSVVQATRELERMTKEDVCEAATKTSSGLQANAVL